MCCWGGTQLDSFEDSQLSQHLTCWKTALTHGGTCDVFSDVALLTPALGSPSSRTPTECPTVSSSNLLLTLRVQTPISLTKPSSLQIPVSISRYPPVLLTEWLQIWRSQPLLSFANSLEWLSELRKTCLILPAYSECDSGTVRVEGKLRARSGREDLQGLHEPLWCIILWHFSGFTNPKALWTLWFGSYCGSFIT